MSTNLIAILGFGAFGHLIAQALAPHARILVHDPATPAQDRARAAGFRVGGLAQAADCDILVLAMPLRGIGACLAELGPLLRPGQIVLDVCSVKVEPVRLMQALLPPQIEIVATHPMFGPSSAGAGVAGHSIVVCPVRGARWRRMAAFLRARLGLRVIVATPAEHDRQAALSQGLTHLLAHAVASLGSAPRIRTPSFDVMTKALAMVRDDSPDVYHAVTAANPFLPDLRARLIRALAETGA